MDIDEVLGQIKPARRSVPVCLDGSIAAQLDDATARWQTAVLDDAEHNRPSTAGPIVDEVRALHDQAKAATVTFTVEALGSSAWRRLIADHPPSKSEEADGWRWDMETFPLAAVAACCVEPAMTETQAEQLADRLSDAQWGLLYRAVLDVNLTEDTLGKFETGIAGQLISGPNSTTAPPEGSPTASSSANEESLAPAS